MHEKREETDRLYELSFYEIQRFQNDAGMNWLDSLKRSKTRITKKDSFDTSKLFSFYNIISIRTGILETIRVSGNLIGVV